MKNNLETEIKFKLRDKQHAEDLTGRLENMAAPETVLEKNRLFDTARGTLKKKQWVLRVRSVLGVDEKRGLLGEGTFYLTLKTPTEREMTRNEYEATIGKRYEDLHVLVHILERLGFREVFFYEKLRKDFRVPGGGDVLVSVAEVPLLGHWVEFEGEEQDIFPLVSSLGFERADMTTKSSRTLWEEAVARGDVPPLRRITFSRKRRR